jgi:6-pyruvoyltetrahydropterin/6-carboxytetrahydropterin synthase
MFTITVESTFSATHHLRLPGGEIEPIHGHDWKVMATFGREGLDDAGMVVDFHQAQAVLQGVVDELHLTDLHACPGLAGLNPTAEVLAKYVHDRLAGAGFASIRSVSVTEAPGCAATFSVDG